VRVYLTGVSQAPHATVRRACMSLLSLSHEHTMNVVPGVENGDACKGGHEGSRGSARHRALQREPRRARWRLLRVVEAKGTEGVSICHLCCLQVSQTVRLTRSQNASIHHAGPA
jgi:hypothetical protein